MQTPEQTRFDINWLCLYLVFFSLPVIELFGLCNGQPSSLPVQRSIAIAVFAIILTLNGAAGKVSASRRFRFFAISWFVIFGIATSLVAVLLHQMADFLLQFSAALMSTLVITLLVQVLSARSYRYQNLPSFLAGAAALMIGGTCVHGALLVTIKDLPLVYDPVLYRIEYILRLTDITPLVILYSNVIIGPAAAQIYTFLNISIILAAASEFLYAPERIQAGLILRFLVVAAIGYALYYLMPAIAPGPFFGQLFPYHLPELQSVACHAVPAPVSARNFDPRNTMPSLHATWAMLALLALRHSPAWHRMVGILMVAAILITTIGSGQHYTVDWICALPLVILARGISALSLQVSQPARRDAILVGVLLLLGWVLAIRGAPQSLDHPGMIELLAMASVLLPVWLELRLGNAENASIVRQDSVAGAYTGSAVL